MKHVDKFFAYARERHAITLRRASGLPRQEWTKDPILMQYRFCSVFRELDKTTMWFRRHVRYPMRKEPEVLLATVVFRLLNRIETGEAMFNDDNLLGGFSAFHDFAREGETKYLKRAILKRLGNKGPYTTGAYIISSPPGYSKLDGMMKVIGDFYQYSNWMQHAVELKKLRGKITLEDTWTWLKAQDYLGPFHSYEIVTDLRHTALLEQAPDILTWASPGPGARRGSNRVHGRVYNDKTTASREDLIREMHQILQVSRQAKHWPHKEGYPPWEMRDVEHTLCEFDKYERVRTGLGKPRGVYR
jgi:hypothetical protein